MNNKDVMEKFYQYFQQLDYKAMNNCYGNHPIFSDPIFILLKDDEVTSMWEMLCKNAKDFSLSYSNIKEVDEEYATCDWTAHYTFSKTGRKVTNNIKAFMRFKDGKIIEHSDAFRLSDWIRQAFGITGYWLGWTGFMKRTVQKKAKQNLHNFMLTKNASND